MWCIPKITPEYLERMYDILDLYQEAYDYRKPLIGLDEKPKQLIEDSRKSIPMKKGKVEKYDYEYIRRGKANIFMAVEPEGGRRIKNISLLKKEVRAWTNERNQQRCTIDWRFTKEDAKKKFSKHYVT